VNDFGRAYEIGRNFENQNKGTATISDTDTTVVVTLPIEEPDYSYKVFLTTSGSSGTPAAGSKSGIFLNGRAFTTINIGTEVAPGAGNSISIDWEVVRN
jgi:hypothetical protein